MYCKYCGKELPPDGVCACQSSQQTEPLGESPRAPVPPVAPQYAQQPTYYPNPAVVMIQRFSGSTLYLVLCILYSLNILANIVSGLNMGAIVINIPAIILCVGMWLIYAGSKSQLKPTGYTLLSGALIAQIVIVTVGLALACIACVILMFGVAAMGGYMHQEVVGINVLIGVVLVVCIVTLVLNFFYYGGLRKAVTTTRAIVWGENRAPICVPLFPIVLMCIQTAGTLIYTFTYQALVRFFYDYIMQYVYRMIDYSIASYMELPSVPQAWTVYLSAALGIASAVVTIITLIQYRRAVAALPVAKPAF